MLSESNSNSRLLEIRNRTSNSAALSFSSLLCADLMCLKAREVIDY
jgi:hypothetical protein